jgi:hypothetical protein
MWKTEEAGAAEPGRRDGDLPHSTMGEGDPMADWTIAELEEAAADVVDVEAMAAPEMLGQVRTLVRQLSDQLSGGDEDEDDLSGILESIEGPPGVLGRSSSASSTSSAEAGDVIGPLPSGGSVPRSRKRARHDRMLAELATVDRMLERVQALVAATAEPPAQLQRVHRSAPDAARAEAERRKYDERRRCLRIVAKRCERVLAHLQQTCGATARDPAEIAEIVAASALLPATAAEEAPAGTLATTTTSTSTTTSSSALAEAAGRVCAWAFGLWNAPAQSDERHRERPMLCAPGPAPGMPTPMLPAVGPMGRGPLNGPVNVGHTVNVAVGPMGHGPLNVCVLPNGKRALLMFCSPVCAPLDCTLEVRGLQTAGLLRTSPPPMRGGSFEDLRHALYAVQPHLLWFAGHGDARLGEGDGRRTLGFSASDGVLETFDPVAIALELYD